MKLLNRLRALARRRKSATGGIVRYDPDRPPVVLSGCQFPVPAQPPSSARYEGVTVRLRGYTELTAQERQQFLDDVTAVMGRPKSEVANPGQEYRPDHPSIRPNGSTGY